MCRSAAAHNCQLPLNRQQRMFCLVTCNPAYLTYLSQAKLPADASSSFEYCTLVLQASLIEYNADAVEGAMNAVRSALAQGLSWKELGELIKVSA